MEQNVQHVSDVAVYRGLHRVRSAVRLLFQAELLMHWYFKGDILFFDFLD